MKKSGGTRRTRKGKRLAKSAVRRRGARPAARPLVGTKVASAGVTAVHGSAARPNVTRGRHTVRRAHRAHGNPTTVGRASGYRGDGDVRVVFKTPELLEEAERLDFVSSETLAKTVEPGTGFFAAAESFVKALSKYKSRVNLPERLRPDALARLLDRAAMLARLEEEARGLHQKYFENRRKVSSDAVRAIADAWGALKFVIENDAGVRGAFAVFEKWRETMGTPTKKRVLIVVAQDQFRDEEVFEPKAVLEKRGAEVAIGCGSTRDAMGMMGGRVKPNLALVEARAADYDAVLVAGGMGSPTYLWNEATLLKLLRDAHGAGKVVGGICLSGALPAQAGLLRGQKGTVWASPESLAELKKGGVEYTKDPVVVSGRVVTAEGPEAATRFGEAVAKLLGI
ncbi:MAG: DJ-1/PfpI family protein [Deltaproteobacteria bacterium]|nr:DJ-1/PfpI family protein [Deltaproteobacteria bacterium]